MVIIERYCTECKTATPQRHIGVEVRRKNNIDLYKCVYCDSVMRLAKPISKLERGVDNEN